MKETNSNPTLVVLAAIMDQMPSGKMQQSFADLLVDIAKTLLMDGEVVAVLKRDHEEDEEFERMSLIALNTNELELYEMLKEIIQRMDREMQWAAASLKAKGALH